MTEPPADQELLERIVRKDQAALAEIYDRYERSIYAFAYRITQDAMMAEEAMQELFVRIWNRTEGFDPAAGSFRSWMFVVVRRIAIDMLRRRQARSSKQLAEPQQFEAIVDQTQNISETVETKLIGDQVRQAMQSLRQEQRKIIEDIYFQGFTQQEVSERQEIPLGTVKSRLRLGLQQLKRMLAGNGKEEVSP